jgi:hypothetical protein
MICQLILATCLGYDPMLDRLRKLLGAKERENYVEMRPQDLYRGIAENTDLTKEEVAMIGGVESQHGKYLDNMAGSSAKGHMQIMPRLAQVLRPGSENNLKDINVQKDVASDFLNLNTPTIKELAADANRKADVIDHYAMYNLGHGRGKKFLPAPDDMEITKVLPAQVIKANPKLYNHKTVGEAKQAMKQFLEQRGSEISFYPDEKEFGKLFTQEEKDV